MINQFLSNLTFFEKKVLHLGFFYAIRVFIKFIVGSTAVNIYNASKFNYNFPAIAASHLCRSFNFLVVENY